MGPHDTAHDLQNACRLAETHWYEWKGQIEQIQVPALNERNLAPSGTCYILRVLSGETSSADSRAVSLAMPGFHKFGVPFRGYPMMRIVAYLDLHWAAPVMETPMRLQIQVSDSRDDESEP